MGLVKILLPTNYEKVKKIRINITKNEKTNSVVIKQSWGS